MLSDAQIKALIKIGFNGTVTWYDIHPVTRTKLLKMRLVRRLSMATITDRLELTGAGRAALEAQDEQTNEAV